MNIYSNRIHSGFVLALLSLPNKISDRTCSLCFVQIGKWLPSLDSTGACAGVAGLCMGCLALAVALGRGSECPRSQEVT